LFGGAVWLAARPATRSWKSTVIRARQNTHGNRLNKNFVGPTFVFPNGNVDRWAAVGVAHSCTRRRKPFAVSYYDRLKAFVTPVRICGCLPFVTHLCRRQSVRARTISTSFLSPITYSVRTAVSVDDQAIPEIPTYTCVYRGRERVSRAVVS